MQLDKLLVLLILIFLPFDATDYFSFKIGELQIGAVDIIILVALIVVILKNLATHYSIRMNPVLMLVILLTFGFSLVSLVWTWPSKRDIKLSLNYLEYIGLFIVLSQVIRDKEIFERILRVLLFIVACLSALTILKSLGVNLSGKERIQTIPIWIFRLGVVGLEEQYTPFSLLLLTAIPLVWQKNLIKPKEVRIGLNMLFFIAGLITLARGLYVSLVALIVARLYFSYFRRMRGREKMLAIVGLIIGIVILAWISLPFMELLRTIRPKTFDRRMEGYILAIDLAMSGVITFLFGYGKDNFFIINNNTVPHNIFIDIWVSKGIITLIFNIIIIYMIIYRLIKSKYDCYFINEMKESLLLGFFGMIIAGQFDPIANSIIFWTYLAIIYAFTLIPQVIDKNINFYKLKFRTPDSGLTR